jgi:hypothetical protein
LLRGQGQRVDAVPKGRTVASVVEKKHSDMTPILQPKPHGLNTLLVGARPLEEVEGAAAHVGSLPSSHEFEPAVDMGDEHGALVGVDEDDTVTQQVNQLNHKVGQVGF